MSITYTGVNGGSYVNTITGPSPGDLVTAGSVGIIAQGAANLSKRLYDTKVERSGDTMTGALDVTAAAASGDVGVTATGNGVGSGVFGTGGATSGAGVEGVGGAPNGKGVYGEGAGTGIGGEFEGGATGRGVVARGGATSGAALDVGRGNAVFTGTSPTATADPGANNLLAGSNVPKAWAMIETDVAPSVTLLDGHNIASLAINVTYVEVTLARAMANANYAVMVQNADATPYWAEHDHALGKTTTVFRIHWRDAAGVNVDPTSATFRASLVVMGRQ